MGHFVRVWEVSVKPWTRQGAHPSCNESSIFNKCSSRTAPSPSTTGGLAAQTGPIYQYMYGHLFAPNSPPMGAGHDLGAPAAEIRAIYQRMQGSLFPPNSPLGALAGGQARGWAWAVGKGAAGAGGVGPDPATMLLGCRATGSRVRAVCNSSPERPVKVSISGNHGSCC